MAENAFDLCVCPLCKGTLKRQGQTMSCTACDLHYPFMRGIPDFLPPYGETIPILRHVGKIGKIALVYERIWYPIFLNMVGGWHTCKLRDIVAYVREKMSTVKGLVLDVATGTGTYGRRVAGAERIVYGIDLSIDMMRVGQVHVRREGVRNMQFLRSDVERLPFSDSLFDGCLLCGSLHLFPDTIKALTEIGRTMKTGAPLAVFTLALNGRGILKYEGMRALFGQRVGLKVFDLPTLEKLAEKAGFEKFEPLLKGAILLFTARKA